MDNCKTDLKKFSSLYGTDIDLAKAHVLSKYHDETPKSLYAIASMHRQLARNSFKHSFVLLVINVLCAAVVIFCLANFPILMTIEIPLIVSVFIGCFFALLVYEIYNSFKLANMHGNYSSVLTVCISTIRARNANKHF